MAAALLDALAGDERVVTARINDPDRGFPGDVAIRAAAATGGFKAVFEVRDKVVSTSDIEHFAAKVSARRISSACILAVSSGQPVLDPKKLAEIAEAHVVFLQMIIGWKDAVNQVLLWAERSPDLSAQIVAERVYVRAQELEVSPEGVGHWTAAIAGK